MARVKQSNLDSHPPGSAIPLLQEYADKLRLAIRDFRAIRAELLSAKEKRIKEKKEDPGPHPHDQQLWQERVVDYQSLHTQRTTLLRNLVPPTRRLAQHVSQPTTLSR